MSEPLSDPPDAALLFSPPRLSERDPSTDAPLPADTSISSADEAHLVDQTCASKTIQCFVEIPTLTSFRKAKYRSIADDEFNSDLEYEGVDCVVGKVVDGKHSHLYVRYLDGVVHRVPARSFEYRFPNLVRDYEASQAAGTLPSFNPNSSEVHPTSRPGLIKIPALKPRRTTPAVDEWSSDELAADPESEDFVDEDSPVKRRSTRTAAVSANRKLGNHLPFSPKKTRGRAIIVHNTDSDSEPQRVEQPTRRSTRARRSRPANLDDEDFEDISDDSAARSTTKSAKKVVRGKASRPAYGHFRMVVDLVIDEEEINDSLLAHRDICEKCHTGPAHLQQAKLKKGRKRRANDDESEDEETRVANLGGWVRCLKCPVVAHWGCLAQTQRDEILRAANERDKLQWLSNGSNAPEPRKRVALETFQTTEFICGSCMKGGICLACKAVVLKPDQATPNQPQPATSDPAVLAEATVHALQDDSISHHELLFRCFTCKRLAHYSHMPVPNDYDPDDIAEIASYYQSNTGWKCADCFSLVYMVEHILAWRPFPEDAIEPPRSPSEPPNHKAMLPREYLIKWVDRSYRRVQWVPHGWLLAVAPNKLKNFLRGGPKVSLLPEPISDQVPASGECEQSTFEIGRQDSETPLAAQDRDGTSLLAACPDAERKIPLPWRTTDRVLDVLLWRPSSSSSKGKKKKARIQSPDDSGDEDPKIQRARDAAFSQGEEPPSSLVVTIDQFESLAGCKLHAKHVDQVAWAFIKWDDLGYDDASWDSPPQKDDPSRPAFQRAFMRMIASRSVIVPSRSKSGQIEKHGLQWLPEHRFTVDSQPDLGQDSKFKLMPFQVDGVNWLCHNWNIDQNCILADEMGLGKTVQIVSFIGYIVASFKAFPALVVVPNSTITNWVREFERWAPKLRVVPFYGEAKSREVIKRYELFHSNPARDTTGAKYHVLVTTYETVINPREFGPVFRSTPRWEILVVDEGQRLKSDASLIFKRLKELNTFHRIIMTGTPLNNNIRELFNLMNFLDPKKWKDLEALSKEYEELTDELVKELHTKLKPYFLRRIKSEVLQLPPKNEVIVPISMAPLQKEIYRSILSQNLDILRSLAEADASKGNNAMTKTNMNNMLMQLRKCLQHPYLVSDTIEPRDLPPQETHDRLIGASAKLRLLKMLLPKLRNRGHRVLLFSQFVIALDIIEDFLAGEGIKYLRLDGNTKQAVRQKGMDEFNKPDSDVFIYLLTTRAGGVGINLWTADTVIIFDPDFNPHQDLQAIARAHRYGQKKTVLVFKLMVKDSAEERIMQTGKKKLVLDHLIVQKINDDSESKEDVQSILMFGAKALFEDTEETAAREVHYSEHDIDNLIEKTEREGDQVEPESGPGSLFAFAKVWSADKEGLQELAEDLPEHAEEADSWSKALELIAARKATEKQKELTGRGVRRKAAAVFPQQTLDLGDSPSKDKEKGKSKKRKAKGKSAGSDDSDFHAPVSDHASDSDGTIDAPMDVDEIRLLPAPSTSSPPPHLPRLPPKQPGPSRHKRPDIQRPLSPAQAISEEFCGLCSQRHAAGQCSMTDKPEYLAQYRLMLMQHAGDETPEERRAAIRVIDETLHRLGKIHLIYGQPLQLVELSTRLPAPQLAKRPKVDIPVPRPVVQTLPVPGRPSNIAAQPVAGPSRVNGAPTAAPPNNAPRVSQAPTPSKRPPSPTLSGGAPKAKKAKDAGSGASSCVVCGRVPHHLVKDCPVVAQGPLSVSEAIQRLSKSPEQAATVTALKSILIKLQRRALAASSAQTKPGHPLIDPNGS